MPVGMTFADISTVLAEINKAATGQEPTSDIIDTSSFVSVAEATLRTGTDPVLNAISQVMTKTIFAVRPYNALMRGLEKDGSAWGNHVRKLNFFDQDPVKDTSYSLPADGSVGTEAGGDSVDPWPIHRPKVLQTNYYGITTYARPYTQTMVQLESAFHGPDELAQFWGAFATHLNNQIAQDRENLARLLVANRAAGTPSTSPTSVVYLLDEYNAETGKTLTAQTVFAPENFPDFARYAFARINDISDLMRARTINWHQNWEIGDETYNFMRHTPYDRQHLYLSSRLQRQIDSRVLSDTYNSGMLQYRDVEMIPFWQTPDDREAVKVTPITTTSAGVAQKASANVGLDNIFGVLFDDDALGYTPIASRVLATPVNARAQYINFWYHYGWRWYNDFTENCVVFLLTSADVSSPSGLSTMSLESNAADDNNTVVKTAKTAKKS